jgi:hypothetical protein
MSIKEETGGEYGGAVLLVYYLGDMTRNASFDTLP